MIRRNEIIFIFAVLALLSGVYFFVQKKLTQPPEEEQEKRLKELIEKRQKEAKKHKQFKSREEMTAYYETLRKKYPKGYAKYKKMIENK